MTDDKAEKTRLVFEDYERRFAQTKLERPIRRPWKNDDREAIICDIKNVLKYDDKLIPSIRVVSRHEIKQNGYTICDYCYETWLHFYGVSTLYTPDNVGENEKRPLVFVCPGHSGRPGANYQQMAIRLVRQGALVLLIENIGQGDRTRFGHWDCVVPFACGLTLQGMILMETVAVIRWAQDLPHVDSARMGACGVSGGGLLTCFLSALAPELATIVSCGYPSDFDYIMQKEKKHCCCNLLPGVSEKLEMWQVYSLFAPKPLMLEQGSMDDLFPSDLFYSIVRKVKHTYAMTGNSDMLSYCETQTGHAWKKEDRDQITAYLARVLSMPCLESEEATPEEIRPGKMPTVVFPDDAITTDEVAMQLTGKAVAPDIRLEDVYPPMYHGKRLLSKDVSEKNVRSDVMRILAQFEMALH